MIELLLFTTLASALFHTSAISMEDHRFEVWCANFARKIQFSDVAMWRLLVQVDSKEGFTYLETHGYVVFKNVLSLEEIDHAKDLCWKFLQTGFDAKRGDAHTWKGNLWPANGDAQVGLMNDYGFGQSEFVWYIRDKPKVKKVIVNKSF
jgi:hypothetical protein